MVDNYSQSVEIEVSSRAKRLQMAGIALVLFSLGFVLVSVFYNWFFMFGFAVFCAAGIVCMHFYNKTAKEYIYEVNPNRLVIVKKDVMNKQTRVLSLLLKDVTDFCIMNDICNDIDDGGDFLFCNKAYDMGVYQIVFKTDGGDSKRVLFVPDEYMIALIQENLQNINNEKK